MALLVILMFLATPFIEIALFIKVGGWIGVLPTIGLTILTSAAGLAIVKNQGLSNLTKMQKSFAQEEMPIAEMIHAMFLSLAGLFLALPGFFTDFLGLLLLVPPIRSLIGLKLLSRMRVTMHTTGGQTAGTHPWANGKSGQTGVVDAEFWEVPDHPQNDNHRLPPRANE